MDLFDKLKVEKFIYDNLTVENCKMGDINLTTQVKKIVYILDKSENTKSREYEKTLIFIEIDPMYEKSQICVKIKRQDINGEINNNTEVLLEKTIEIGFFGDKKFKKFIKELEKGVEEKMVSDQEMIVLDKLPEFFKRELVIDSLDLDEPEYN